MPAQPFEFAQWKRVRVNIDYHVDIERHYYSVPYQLIGEELDARITERVIECFHRGKRVASHARSWLVGRFTTLAEHMPASHRAHREWTPGRLIAWGGSIGPHTQALVSHQLHSRPHPEQGYRACLGLRRLVRAYGKQRLEAACERALAIGAANYTSVDSILKRGLDRQPLPRQAEPELPLPVHENVRGPKAFQ